MGVGVRVRVRARVYERGHLSERFRALELRGRHWDRAMSELESLAWVPRLVLGVLDSAEESVHRHRHEAKVVPIVPMVDVVVVTAHHGPRQWCDVRVDVECPHACHMSIVDVSKKAEV